MEEKTEYLPFLPVWKKRLTEYLPFLPVWKRRQTECLPLLPEEKTECLPLLPIRKRRQTECLSVLPLWKRKQSVYHFSPCGREDRVFSIAPCVEEKTECLPLLPVWAEGTEGYAVLYVQVGVVADQQTLCPPEGDLVPGQETILTV